MGRGGAVGATSFVNRRLAGHAPLQRLAVAGLSRACELTPQVREVCVLSRLKVEANLAAPFSLRAWNGRCAQILLKDSIFRV